MCIRRAGTNLVIIRLFSEDKTDFDIRFEFLEFDFEFLEFEFEFELIESNCGLRLVIVIRRYIDKIYELWE